MESLIRNIININGITIGKYERKLVQFADEAPCLLADLESVENIIRYFQVF